MATVVDPEVLTSRNIDIFRQLPHPNTWNVGAKIDAKYPSVRQMGENRSKNSLGTTQSKASHVNKFDLVHAVVPAVAMENERQVVMCLSKIKDRVIAAAGAAMLAGVPKELLFHVATDQNQLVNACHSLTPCWTFLPKKLAFYRLFSVGLFSVVRRRLNLKHESRVLRVTFLGGLFKLLYQAFEGVRLALHFLYQLRQ